MSTVESKELIEVKTLVPTVVFAPGGVDKIIVQVEAAVRAETVDISSKKGRDACKSLARKIASTKTGLDGMGKELVAKIKAQSNLIDADRRKLWNHLESLQGEVRKPLDEWEAAEKERVEGHEAAFVALRAMSTFEDPDPSSEEVDARITAFVRREPRDWQEFEERAIEAAEIVRNQLEVIHTRAQKREADDRELARLRQEAADRQAKDAADAALREAAERERLAAEAEEARKEAHAKAIEEAAQAAAEKARHEAAAEKEAAVLRAENAEREAKEAADRAEQARVEAAEQFELDRQAAVAAEQKRQTDAKAAEDAAAAKREANKKHAAKINNEALAAIRAAGGVTDDAARAIVEAIARGKVPHIKISY